MRSGEEEDHGVARRGVEWRDMASCRHVCLVSRSVLPGVTTCHCWVATSVWTRFLMERTKGHILSTLWALSVAQLCSG